MKTVVVISSKNCKSCIKTKQFLNDNKIKYIEYDTTDDRAMKVFSSVVHSLPTVIIFEKTKTSANLVKYWGGYSETKLEQIIKGE